MRGVGLFSGGKDSTFALYKVREEHEIVGLLTVISKNRYSWMFHYPCIELAPLQAEAMRLPLTQVVTEGVKEAELDDLKRGLKSLRDKLGVEAVVSGAVASQYQRSRIDRLCEELNLTSLTPLWHQEPEGLLRGMLEAGFEVVFTAVAAKASPRSGWVGGWMRRRWRSRSG